MRLIIVAEDGKISIDGVPITGCDLSWVPEFTGNYTGVSQKVHAVQWYDDHGEIELQSHDLAIPITELGIFEQAISKFEERKLVVKAEAAEAAEKLAAEEQMSLANIDIDQLLAELEAEVDNENVGIAST